jgi:hypothetical protein
MFTVLGFVVHGEESTLTSPFPHNEMFVKRVLYDGSFEISGHSRSIAREAFQVHDEELFNAYESFLVGNSAVYSVWDNT